MKKIIFVLLSCLALSVFTQKDVFACECFFLPQTVEEGIKEKLKTNKAVFSGEVVSIKASSMSQAIVKGGARIPGLMVKFKVAKSWKDTLPEEITINTLSNHCGYPFQIGKRYLVYAFASEQNYLTTSSCSENKEIEKAAEELKILGTGKRPRKIKL